MADKPPPDPYPTLPRRSFYVDAVDLVAAPPLKEKRLKAAKAALTTKAKPKKRRRAKPVRSRKPRRKDTP